MAGKVASKKGASKKGMMVYEDPEEALLDKKMMGKKKPRKVKK